MESDIWAIIKPVLDFWTLASLICTMVIVQLWKVGLKNSPIRPRLDNFWIGGFPGLIVASSIVIGYATTLFLKAGAPAVEKWAFMIGILNAGIYEALLAYAGKNQKLWLLAFLKMRKIERRGNTTKMYDESGDHTVVAVEHPRRRRDDQ